MNLNEYLKIFSEDEISFKTKFVLKSIIKKGGSKIDQDLPICSISLKSIDDFEKLAKNAYF